MVPLLFGSRSSLGLGSPMADDWTKLTSLPTRHEANLLAGRLRQAGIRSQVMKATDDSAGWLKAFGTDSGLFHIYVPAAKAGAAKQKLVGSTSSKPGRARSDRRAVQVVGRVLIFLALVGVVVALAWDILSWS